MLKIYFTIHSLIEIVGGFVILFNPTILLLNDQADIITLNIVKLCGIMSMTIGIVYAVLTKNFTYSHLFKHLTLIIFSYHLVVSLYLYGLSTKNILLQVAPFIIHMSMAIIGLVIYLNQKDKFELDGKSA